MSGKRAVLYARVSSDDRGKDGRNLASQLDMCREYAQGYGYAIVEELAEDDRGARGADLDLPMLNKALEMAQAGEFDVLVVREIDRFARSLAKQLIIESQFERAGVQVEYVLGEYPDTPEGNLNKNIKAVIAEYERLKIAERNTRGRRNIARAGHVITHGHTPYGYREIKRDGKNQLEIYEPEARIVRLIFQWYTVGDGDEKPKSGRAIAIKLTDMGIPSPRKGAAWPQTTVMRILHRETYAGTWHYSKSTNGVVLDHSISVEVPAIIDRETWRLAQARYEHNRKNSRRNTKYRYLLRPGHIRCAHCTTPLEGVAKKRRKHDRVDLYYRCPVGARTNWNYCYNRTCEIGRYYPTKLVDAAVWDWVKGLMIDPSQLTNGLEDYQAGKEKENAPLCERLEVVEDLLSENQAQLERLLDLYLSGDLPRDMLTDRKKRYEMTIDALKQERANLVTTLRTHTLTQEHIRTIEAFAAQVRKKLTIADDDFGTKRSFIELLDVQVKLAVEENSNGREEKVAYVSCEMLGKEEIVSITSPSS